MFSYIFNWLGWKNNSLRVERVYGWKRDTTSTRNNILYHQFLIPSHQSAIQSVNLRSMMPPVYDQGKLGSCSANALACCYEFDQMKQKEPNPFCPSRLFIYYNERRCEGHVNTDSGAELKDGVECLANIGVCEESSWQYDVTKFTEEPPSSCYTTALNHLCTSYRKIEQSQQQIKQALIEGYPVVCGIMVYEGFESQNVSQTGNVPLPNTSTEKLLGGHAVVLTSFNDSTGTFGFRNSWGEGWGDKGYGTLPYSYILDQNLAGDFWILIQVKDQQ